jgi:3-methyladenine DNA glycosylase/8-oxoguanine DNA glycosylase
MSVSSEIMVRMDTPPEYNLRHTMIGHRMGSFDPTLRVDDHRVQLAIRTPDGPVGLVIDQHETNVEARGWGDGSHWIAERLDRLLGLQDSPKSFQPSDRVMKSLVRRFSGMHLPRFPRVFDRVVQVILLQRVSWRDAVAAWKRMVQRLGEDAPGPLSQILPPCPRTLASTPYYELVGCGVPHRQARTIQQVAFHARRIEESAEQGIESFTKTLSAIPGIGPWTIGYLHGIALADPDATLPGDYNLPHTVSWVLAGEERGDEKRMMGLLEPYRGHRFRVIRLIWMKGAKPPRHGPPRGFQHQ